MHTPDKAEENFKKLSAMFPNAVTETVNENGEIVHAIDADVLQQEISGTVIAGGVERYQFTWPDKKKSVVLANQPINKTLRLDRKKSVGRDGTPGSIDTENIYIEGDNLDALKLLQETYLGKVKMIYIDPPYNTGADLIYDDNFSQEQGLYAGISAQLDDDGNRLVENTESNGRFHTDWLNMLYPRLRLSKDLLSIDGVIFISIDDNENNNLKKICDEVFGATNFIGQITVVGNPRGRDYGGIARMHDYILVYRKSESAELNLIEDKENEFKLFDDLGGFELRELRNRNIKFNKENRPNLYYPFFVDPNTEDKNGLHPISLDSMDGWIELWPLESQGINVVWRWGKEKSQKNLNVNIMAKPMRNGSYMIVEKYRESRVMARSVWWDKDTNTEKGTLLIKELMEGKVFDYPKPVEMIQRIVEMGTSAGDIVLDFFSGSGTSAHALLNMNAKDDGGRLFIMIQLPESAEGNTDARKAGFKTICDIGEERIRRAGKKIKEEHPNANLDIGFRVFKVDSSNMKDVYYKPDGYDQGQIDLFADNIKEDRTPEDLLFQVMLDLGISLSSKIEESVINDKKVFVVGGEYTTLDGSSRTHLIACFDKDITDDTVKAIAEKHPSYAVFRDSCMANDCVATNFEQIFETYSPNTVRKVL